MPEPVEAAAAHRLAPALRQGWLLLPPQLVEPVARQRNLSDHGAPTLEQLALARMIESGAYDRHLRQARRRHRLRRDALVAAVARHLGGARVTGLAAGLHAIVRLAHEFDAATLMRAAAGESVGVYPLAFGFMEPRSRGQELVLGYANLSEQAIEEGIRRLARALERTGLGRGRAPRTRARERPVRAAARRGSAPRGRQRRAARSRDSG